MPVQEQVDALLPPYSPEFRLDVADPHTFGAICLDSNFMRLRLGIQEAMEESANAAIEVDNAFKEVFGRHYGLVEPYRLDGAKTILVTAGTASWYLVGGGGFLQRKGGAGGPIENPDAEALSFCTSTLAPR